MAHQIAVALENAKLYRRLEEKFELTASELKKTQEKLIRTERLTAMGHLVQGVAHEIRNPIMTIGGFAYRAKSSQADDKKRQRYLDIILEETARLEKLVQDVHEFAEIQTVRLSPGRLEDVVREVLGGMETEAEEREVTLKAVTEDALPPIDMDFSQLKQALRNVLVNALESMDDGGVIDLRVGREDDHVAITVCDTGCGIPEKDLDAVYDPFVTSKTRGAGLGLTMVHQIVMNHRGEIGIQSKEGEGTTVTIRLPFSPHHDWKEQA
jgi:signal transduction histidine kinase